MRRLLRLGPRSGGESAPRPGTVPWRPLAVLWLLGMDLRLSVLALAPLEPDIRHRLVLSEAALGALSTVPVLLLALAATGGSAVVARAGPRRAVALGLTLAAVAGALRAAGPSTLALFAGSVLMGLGIAVAQPAMPVLASRWWPERVGLSTALYGNGAIVGEALAASLTLTVLVPLLGSWEAALALWSAPLLVGALLVSIVSPGQSGGPRHSQGRHQAWWPAWRRRETWLVGAVQAAGSVAYFGTNAYLSTAFHARDEGGLAALGLSALNLAQLPASLVVGVVARRRMLPAPLLSAAGITVTAGCVLVAGFHGLAAVAGAALVGAGSATGFVVALALPPLLASEPDVARLSAGMFTIGYALAFLLPLCGGLLWDLSGVAALAFLPVLAGGIGLGLAGASKSMLRTASSLAVPGGARDAAD